MLDRVYRWIIALARGFFRVLAVRFDIRGTEHLPATGPAVIACNHTGFLDFTFIGIAMFQRRRMIRFLAKRSVFATPVTGQLMRIMRHIPVDRGSGVAAYEQAGRELQAGEFVGIFPEATISRAWTLKPFRPGAARLALDHQVPLIPVVHWGGHRLWTVDGHHSFRRRTPVTVLIGSPIVATGTPEEVAGELYRRMQELLDTAQRDYPDRPADEADRWWLPRHLGGTAPTPAEAAARDAAKMTD